MTDFYSFRVKGIDGVGDLLAPLRGSVALVVNVASQCGYTPQYAGLERLYRELKGQRFTVIGFPCNQFGQQEPGAEADIIRFCTVNYNVTFPLSTKVEVNGANRHPLYAWLTAPENGCWLQQSCVHSAAMPGDTDPLCSRRRHTGCHVRGPSLRPGVVLTCPRSHDARRRPSRHPTPCPHRIPDVSPC